MHEGQVVDVPELPTGDELYTEDVKSLIYQCKRYLPLDYQLATRTEDVYIFIQIPKNQFDWRAVEDKARIAITLERLRQLIKGTGVNCEIETVPSLTPFG